jgi:hypothetical protein
VSAQWTRLPLDRPLQLPVDQVEVGAVEVLAVVVVLVAVVVVVVVVVVVLVVLVVTVVVVVVTVVVVVATIINKHPCPLTPTLAVTEMTILWYPQPALVLAPAAPRGRPSGPNVEGPLVVERTDRERGMTTPRPPTHDNVEQIRLARAAAMVEAVAVGVVVDVPVGTIDLRRPGGGNLSLHRPPGGLQMWSPVRICRRAVRGSLSPRRVQRTGDVV